MLGILNISSLLLTTTLTDIYYSQFGDEGCSESTFLQRYGLLEVNGICLHGKDLKANVLTGSWEQLHDPCDITHSINNSDKNFARLNKSDFPPLQACHFFLV